MTKKKIIVHVGPPKTGTSVLQFWLNENSTKLAELGFYYPSHDVDGNRVSSGHRGLFLEKLEGTTRTTFVNSKFEILLNDFERSGCGTLLLSSEFFFFQIPEFLKYKFEYEIVFIAYVRADVDLIESLYNQSVKRNGQIKPLAIRERISSSYLDELYNFVTTYPVEHFSLRAYGDASVFYGENIVQDFLYQLGVEPSSLTAERIEKVNSSYSFDGLEFKRWLNNYSLGKLESKIDLFLQSLAVDSKSYTLLPYEAFSRYRAQSIEKIIKISRVVPIENVDFQLCYLNNKERPPYIHQDLYPQHLIKLSRALFKKDPTLYKELISTLFLQINSESERSRLAIMQSVEPEKSNMKNNSWNIVSRLYATIKKRFLI